MYVQVTQANSKVTQAIEKQSCRQQQQAALDFQVLDMLAAKAKTKHRGNDACAGHTANNPAPTRKQEAIVTGNRNNALELSSIVDVKSRSRRTIIWRCLPQYGRDATSWDFLGVILQPPQCKPKNQVFNALEHRNACNVCNLQANTILTQAMGSQSRWACKRSRLIRQCRRRSAPRVQNFLECVAMHLYQMATSVT